MSYARWIKKVDNIQQEMSFVINRLYGIIFRAKRSNFRSILETTEIDLMPNGFFFC